jgi:hypothetical protein
VTVGRVLVSLRAADALNIAADLVAAGSGMRQARPGYWSWSAEWWPPDWCSSARLAALLGWSRCCVGLCRSPPPCPPGHPGDSSWMSCARTPCGSPRPVGRCCSRCGPARTAGSSRCATAAPASPTTSWSRSSGARFTSATAACEGHQRARAGPRRARLVRRLGGTIEAGHAPEGGARFAVTLPYDDPVLAENVIRAGQAACSYSWRMPARRSRRRMCRGVV